MVKKYSKNIIQILVKRGRRIYLEFGDDLQPIIPIDIEWIYNEIDGKFTFYDKDIIDTLLQNCNKLRLTKNCIIFTI